jgi:heme exporter protein A
MSISAHEMSKIHDDLPADGLRANGLAVMRGDHLVFRDLSFAVHVGGALLLTGPNGSGKSTLLRLLAGLLRPAAGSVTWNGQNVFEDRSTHTRLAAYLGHLDAIKPGLSAIENLTFPAAIGGGAPHQALRAQGLLELADLPARMLSAGQRRRLALARLGLSRRTLWLLDEPTVGLDSSSIERFGTMLAAHRASGGIVIASTHLPFPLPDAAQLTLDKDMSADSIGQR